MKLISICTISKCWLVAWLDKYVTPSTQLVLYFFLYCLTTTCFGPSGPTWGETVLGFYELYASLFSMLRLESEIRISKHIFIHLTYSFKSCCNRRHGNVVKRCWALSDTIYEYVICYNRCHDNAVKGFWALWYNIYECVICYNRCHDNAVKGFWALWYNIYGGVFTTFDFLVILHWQFTSYVK
jgi:hypothetical protein